MPTPPSVQALQSSLSNRLYSTTAHHSVFVLFWLLSLVIFRSPLYSLVSLSLKDDRYSFNSVIPCLSVLLIYFRRSALPNFRYCLSVGIPLVLLGAAVSCIAARWPSAVDPAGSLWVGVSAMLLAWMGGFIACYGPQAFKAALFPLCFLVWMVPIPKIALDKLSLLLQTGSAEAAYALVKLTGVPVFRQGFAFSLPGLDVEVAEQCSGIRSGLALLITGSLAAYVFLQSWQSRSCLGLAIIPVAIFKNAVRIVTISYLGLYVNQGFLHGWLHRNAGLPFSVLAVAILMPLVLVLRRSEVHRAERRGKIRCAEVEYSGSA